MPVQPSTPPTTRRPDAAGAAGPAPERSGAIEFLRFLGAAGIVWFHMRAPEAWIGHSAVQLFAMLTVLFLCHSTRKYEFSELATMRARRLLLPWLAWSAVYAAAKLLETALAGARLTDEFAWSMLLMGASMHLWFLPAMFVMGMFASVLVRTVRSDGALFAVALALSLAAQAYFASLDPLPAPPVREWLHVLPSAFAGVAIFAARRDRRYLAALLAAHAALVALLPDFGGERTLLALALAVVGVSIAVPAPAALRFLGMLSMTIYLAHPLVGSVLTRLTGAEAGAPLALTALLGSIIYALLQDDVLRRARAVRRREPMPSGQ